MKRRGTLLVELARNATSSLGPCFPTVLTNMSLGLSAAEGENQTIPDDDLKQGKLFY